LSNKIGKGLGAVFAREDLVFWGIGFGHWDKLRPRPRGVHLQRPQDGACSDGRDGHKDRERRETFA
jgi:hypothetical protein